MKEKSITTRLCADRNETRENLRLISVTVLI